MNLNLMILYITAISYPISVSVFSDEADTVSVTGDVILRYGAPIYFPNNSCLHMYIKEDIKCEDCDIPVLSTYHMVDPQIIDRRIPYKLVLKKPQHGPFTIQATFNNGWCQGGDDEWIRYGDYKNDEAVVFILEKGQLSQEMDIEVIEYKRTAYSESYLGNDFKFNNHSTILVHNCIQFR